MKLFHHLELTLSSLVFPLYCPACGGYWIERSGGICSDCWSNLPAPGRGRWFHEPALKGKVSAAFHYDDISRNLVHLMKFRGRIDIAREIGVRAADRLKSLYSQSELACVIPVPLHPVRIRERGYDQSLVIAESVAKALSVPLIVDIIRRTRNTPPQSRLSDVERISNLKDAFSASLIDQGTVSGTILLIDDVIHTGATVMGCIKTLAKSGIKNIRILAAFG
ncbi:ComF family protein [bacterium]|nr:ComF family protein [bacterium]